MAGPAYLHRRHWGRTAATLFRKAMGGIRCSRVVMKDRPFNGRQDPVAQEGPFVRKGSDADPGLRLIFRRFQADACAAAVFVGQTSRRPQRITSAPPIISRMERNSPANTAAVTDPTITSVINRMPTRAGSSRTAAHIKAAIERTHQKAPVKSTVTAMVAKSVGAILGKGSSCGAEYQQPPPYNFNKN